MDLHFASTSWKKDQIAFSLSAWMVWLPDPIALWSVSYFANPLESTCLAHFRDRVISSHQPQNGSFSMPFPISYSLLRPSPEAKIWGRRKWRHKSRVFSASVNKSDSNPLKSLILHGTLTIIEAGREVNTNRHFQIRFCLLLAAIYNRGGVLHKCTALSVNALQLGATNFCLSENHHLSASTRWGLGF